MKQTSIITPSPIQHNKRKQVFYIGSNSTSYLYNEDEYDSDCPNYLFNPKRIKKNQQRNNLSNEPSPRVNTKQLGFNKGQELVGKTLFEESNNNAIQEEIYSRVLYKLSPDFIESESNIIGLEEQQQQVTSMLKGALTEIQPSFHSFLMVGQKGSGRNYLLKHVLKQLLSYGEFRILKINGLSHRDDSSALRDLTKQLAISCVELQNLSKQLEEEENEKEQDDEDNDEEEQQTRFSSVEQKKNVKFSQNLKFITDVLVNENLRKRLRFLLILEEFDSFARKSKQSFLYSILDFAHKPELGGFVIIGLTSRLDVLNLMEKRVKSRFDNRQILFSPTKQMVQIFEIFKRRLRMSLPNGNNNNSSSKDENKKEFQEKILTRQQWNLHIEKLLTVNNNSVDLETSSLKKLIKKLLEQGKSNGFFINLLIHTVQFAKMHHSMFLEYRHFENAYEMLTLNPTNEIIKGLPRIELLLILSMVYLEREKRMDGYTYQSVYECALLQEKNTVTISRLTFEVGWKAFEHLLTLKIIESISEIKYLPLDEKLNRRKHVFKIKNFNKKRKNNNNNSYGLSTIPKEYQFFKLTLIDYDACFLSPIMNGEIKQLVNLQKRAMHLKHLPVL